jgi:hypothetical protein
MELRPILRTLVFASGLLLAATAHAQDRGMTPLAGFGAHDTAPARAESPRYGTTGLTYVRVPGIEFLPEFGSYQDFSASSLERHPLSSSDMRAPLHLPGGAIIDYLEIDFYDLLDPEDIQLFIVNCGSLGDFCHNVANINSFANPGYGAISTSGINYQVDNLLGSLALKAIFGANSPNLTLVGAIVGYRLQVSPAPANATFVDVPTNNIYFQFIEALVASGITSGCVVSPPQFCPDRPITRAEMAVFLAKALGLNFR